MKKVVHRTDFGRNYKGIAIHAAPYVHEDVFDMIKRHANGKYVLDIGTGSGAFSLRLKDNGYSVLAIDLDVDDWSLNEIDVVQVNLNRSFADDLLAKNKKKYDIITGIELIEHLENPTLLLREVKKIINAENGIFVLSTPNVVNLDSRRFFITKGTFFCFQHESYFNSGHISLLPYWLIEKMLYKEGFEIIERRFIGKHYRRGIRKIVPFFNILLLPLGFALPLESAFSPCVAYVCRLKKSRDFDVN